MLPHVRLHDYADVRRHTHATLALKAGVHPRIVQERFGHANVSITLDTNSHLDLDMQAAAARQVAARITQTDEVTPTVPVITFVTTGPRNGHWRRPRRSLTCGNVASTWLGGGGGI